MDDPADLDDPDDLRRLALLCRIADAGGLAEPRAEPQAQRGYEYSALIEDDAADLAFLASHDYLEPHFVDRVSLCPKCGSHHVNLREVCPRCGRANLAVETLLRHQNCGYTGRIGEFAGGEQIDGPLVCPQCHRPLHHLATDYAQAGRTLVCRECDAAAEEPPVEAACLACGAHTAAEDLASSDFFSYALSPLGRAAVDRGALLGEEEELQVVGGARIYPPRVTREFLDRELKRLRDRTWLGRSGQGLSALLVVCRGEAPRSPWLRQLRDRLRDDDLIGQLAEGIFIAILPGTGRRGAEALRRRILGALVARPPIALTAIEIRSPEDLERHLAGRAR